MKTVLSFMAVIAVFALAGCGGGGGVNISPGQTAHFSDPQGYFVWADYVDSHDNYIVATRATDGALHLSTGKCDVVAGKYVAQTRGGVDARITIVNLANNQTVRPAEEGMPMGITYNLAPGWYRATAEIAGSDAQPYQDIEVLQ